MIYCYLACPVRPLPGSSETIERNLGRARRYYKHLSLKHPDRVFLAPWILNCEMFDETPENIEKGMERNFAIIDLIAEHSWAQPAELWLCGPRVSSNMQKEADYAKERGVDIVRFVDEVIEADFTDVPRKTLYSFESES